MQYQRGRECASCNIQGFISTHSDEIDRSCNLRDIKVIRPKDPLDNVICDMASFLEKHKKERVFYETFFKINFSSLIFADKAIIYEGDTERMFIESLIFGNCSEDEKKEFDFLIICMDALVQTVSSLREAVKVNPHY